MDKKEIKRDLDKIWIKYLIDDEDSPLEVIEKLSAGLKEQMEYFKN